MLYCIDRIEDGKAVLVDMEEKELVLPAAQIGKAKEGTWGWLEQSGNFVPDLAITNARRAKMQSRLDALLRR